MRKDKSTPQKNAILNALSLSSQDANSTTPTTQKRATKTTRQVPTRQILGSLVEEPTAAFWALLLLLLLQAGERRDHRTATAATTERFCNAAAEFAAEGVGGCTAGAGDVAVARGSADFGGFETFFYCCELGFETVKGVLAIVDLTRFCK